MSEAAAPRLSSESGRGGDAPPKQVAMAMERLGRAGRLIADIRLGGDRILEALFVAKDIAPSRAVSFLVGEEEAMRRHFKDLRDLGRELEETGVLNGDLRCRGNSWGLHMPLICPDGAVVAYAWKRQLAGQAGASAVDRTRLALNAFTDQKRRFFAHLQDDLHGQANDSEAGMAKKHCRIQRVTLSYRKLEESLSDIIKNMEQEVPNMKIFTYQRADWLERAASLQSENLNVVNPSQEHGILDASKLQPVSANAPAEQVAVIELLIPSIFRAVISLHPAGSMNPDAVSFFSTTEGGNYIHSRGQSVNPVFRHITDHGDKALQFFLSVDPSNTLSLLMRWISSYQLLYTKVCSKCKRLLMMDKSQVLLPPVHRPFRLAVPDAGLTGAERSGKSWNSLNLPAYHIGCSPHAT